MFKYRSSSSLFTRKLLYYQCTSVLWLVKEDIFSNFIFSSYVSIGGRVDGALGDIRDRAHKGHGNLNQWLLRDCPAATRDQPGRAGAPLLECASEDDVSSIVFLFSSIFLNI